MRNREVAATFETLADLLEFEEENAFKVNAYRRVARTIADLPEEIEALVREKRLRELPGVGEAIEQKIIQLVTTGRMDRLEEAKKKAFPGLAEMLRIPGVGPRTIRLAHEKLGVNSLDDLAAAASSGSLAKLPGMGAKRAENVLKSIAFLKGSASRKTLGEALPFVEELIKDLKARGIPGVTVAGSLRRMRETVGDIDLLTTSKDPGQTVRLFTEHPRVSRVLGAGETKASVILDDFQVDLRVVEPEAFGAALQYFTGSKDHSVRLRGIARQKGLKLNEYGLFRGEKRIACRSEEDIYKAFDLPVIPPVLRENRGEIEAAQEGILPELIELSDIRGDLHAHTDWSDGTATIEEMAAAAQVLGYRYLVISDHSLALKVFGGLDAERLRAQIVAVKKAAKKFPRLRLLTGTEVDIRPNGDIDFPDDLLGQLDFVTASVHSAFKQDRETMTRRILKAIENPHVDSIGHLTGRILNRREAYDVDLEAILQAAARHGVALELNAHPARLDLNDQACRRAKELGAKVVINTDSHSTDDLRLMRFGVATAQRGWLEKEDVLNASDTPPLRRKGRGGARVSK